MERTATAWLIALGPSSAGCGRNLTNFCVQPYKHVAEWSRLVNHRRWNVSKVGNREPLYTVATLSRNVLNA